MEVDHEGVKMVETRGMERRTSMAKMGISIG